jgi:hypothetical protein
MLKNVISERKKHPMAFEEMRNKKSAIILIRGLFKEMIEMNLHPSLGVLETLKVTIM